MSKNLSDLAKVILFLNADLQGLKRKVAKKEAIALAKQTTEELAVRQRFLESDLTNLKIVSMEPANSKSLADDVDFDLAMEFQKWLKSSLTAVLKGDLGALVRFVDDINMWIHDKPSYSTWNLRLAEIRPRDFAVNSSQHFSSLIKGSPLPQFDEIESEGSITTLISHALMRAFKAGHHLQIGICPTCSGFFGKTRRWQKYCLDRCKKKAARIADAQRKVRKKQSRKVADRTAQWKRNFRTCLENPRFLKALDSRPVQQHKIREEMRSRLEQTESADDFWSIYERGFRQRIENILARV